MASYSSYRANRFSGSNIAAGTIDGTKVEFGVRNAFTVKWFYGDPNQCSPGCCCLWTVPAGVKITKWELWGAGGNGHGACSNNRCSHNMGASGGTYNTRTNETAPGCQYTVCAAGTYRCLSNECTACNGCSSYVNGYNLSNLCACGGGGGCQEGSWTDGCFTYMDSCMYPGIAGGEFSTNTHYGPWVMSGPYTYPGDACHCWKRLGYSSAGMGMNTGRNEQYLAECWMRCGCWTVPYASGAMGAKTTYCGGASCCGQGGTGGPGVVKVTYY